MLRPTLILSSLTLVASPAMAASYSAKLATPASGRIVAREINWACGPEACEGATDDSRPPVLCQALAKQVGRIDSFLVDVRPFTSVELTRCNAMAKPDTGKKLAAQ